MDRYRYIISLLLCTVLVFSSCNSDDDDGYVYSNNCYISSMVLGQMRRIVTTTTASGNDTTYTVSFSGSYYPLAINPVRQTITSSVPLPVGTRVDAVLVTASFDGVLAYAPAADTTEWKAYSSTDSIDFSSPVIFRVIAADGSGYRDYTATLTVLESDPTDYTWQQMPDAATLEGRSDIRLKVFKENIVAMSKDNAGQYYFTTKGDDDAWTEKLASLPGNVLLSSLQAYDGMLWLSTGDGDMLRSTDGINWSTVTVSPQRAYSLIAASDSAIYACELSADGETYAGVYCSVDGITWAKEDVEGDNMASFPTRYIASVAYRQANGTSRILVAGQTADKIASAVWSLRQGSNEPWTLLSFTGDNNYTLVPRQCLNIVAYNNQLIAIGGEAADDSGYAALDSIYISYDNGITWLASDKLTAPEVLQGTTESLAAISFDNYIWLVAGDKVWRVQLNALK